MDGEMSPRSRGGCRGQVMAYVKDHMRRDGDSEQEVQHKAVWICFLGCVISASAPVALVFHSTAVPNSALLGLFLWAWVRKEVSEVYLRVATVIFCLGIFYYDLLAASVWARLWPLFVALIDVMLVIDAPRYLTTWMVVSACVWLFVVEAEYQTRALGLFDLPDTYSYASRYAITNCEKPPCATNGGAVSWLLALAPIYTVFVLDFFLTRGFAEKVLAEKNRMAAAVDAAEYVAGRLAGFELEKAASYLDVHADGLPAELTATFRTLLANLDSYRPYLPEELFSASGDQPHADMLPFDVPGVCDRRVALAFTDIRSSTALWEANPDAMQVALDLHGEAIRAALAANDGYEVKTIGDAFMVAFHTSMESVRFGGAAQRALSSEVQWPEGLTRPDMEDGFGVLTVRMGIHCGEATAQRNTLTGRFDYFGPMVNRAARVEPFGAPGAVTVTAEVVEDVGVEALEENFAVMPYAEARSGKGLKEPLVLTALVPRGATGNVEVSVRKFVAAVLVEQLSEDLSTISESPPVSPCLSPAGSLSGSPRVSVCTGQLTPSDEASPRSRWTQRRNVFSATVKEGACVGVVNFAFFECEDAQLICDAGSFPGEVARTQHRLQTLHWAVQMTRGQVSSVVGGTAWVSWGLQVNCSQYVDESLRCMGLLRDKLGGESDAGAAPQFHAGLVAGPLATVELAASTGKGRRFVTLLGACVELGAALCGAAAGRGAWVLAASAEGPAAVDSYAKRPGMRQVEGWNAEAGRAWGVEAYEGIPTFLGARGSLSLVGLDNAIAVQATSPSLEIDGSVAEAV